MPAKWINVSLIGHTQGLETEVNTGARVVPMEQEAKAGSSRVGCHQGGAYNHHLIGAFS